MCAELLSSDNGLGFDVLLYWPFNYAYILLVGAIFTMSNMTTQPGESKVRLLATALISWLAWFIITFLAVAQLHLSLGGKL